MTDDGFHLVGWVVLRRGEDVLVARRHGVGYAAGFWGLPGGHVEAGESLAEAAARETLEEVGVEVDPVDLTAVGMCRYIDGRYRGLDVFFAAESFAGEPRPVSECDAVAWAPLDHLPDPPLPWLPAALRRHLIDGLWFSELL